MHVLVTTMIAFIVIKCAFLLILIQQIAVAQFHEPPGRHRHLILREKAALLAFKSSITPETRAALSNWNESTEVCEFVGVICNRWHLHVTHLQLGSKSIAGPLSPVLANLTGLVELDLSDNFLAGHIPHELSNLRRLNFLELSGNQISGRIPESLAYISSLGYLNLGSNLLVGPIPDSIFINCTQLGVIDLSRNALSGRIPSKAAIDLPMLLTFNLYLNNLNGYLPLWLSNSSFLVQIDVEDNHLSGVLPSDMIQKMSELVVLHLSSNAFSSHDNNTNLDPFFLALSNCSNLKELEMARLGVGGQLPRTIGSGTRSLSIVNLDDNMITGYIPPDIANLSNLTLLNLSSNLLDGTIPTEIGHIRFLERIILSSNLLHGSIPVEIGNLSSLGLLDLSDNRLSGKIPESLGNLSHLSDLYLQNNHLSGSIPSSLGRCMSLNKLDLSYNRLTGMIPPEISSITKIYFNLSNNLLQGPLPMELSKMDQVQEINLSSNNLTGELIPQLSSCVELELLNVSHNHLTGLLPRDFGNLQNLEVLDVSYNHLEGEIPLSLNKCTNLILLDLSYNDFNGSIPTGGIFSLFSNLSYQGNPNLCGSGSNKACPKKLKRLHSRKFLIAISAGASAAAIAITLCCFVAFRRIRKLIMDKKGDTFGGSSSPVVKSSYPRITYRELVEATEDFDERRLIGSGSYGRVFKGVLKDGTIIAVKVLNLQTGNSTRSFNRECQVLKRIRHRNLMRIITACSLPEFKALVLPFMANGSLEKCLYSGSCELSLIQRVSICSDIAEGMAYLHHHSPFKVVHCDLKPSNVLLNDEMTALVSDFGIARLVMSVGAGNTVENVSSSTANMLCGSIGYIAPEYGYGSNASTKGDVYSFGVLLLEVVTRRRPTDEMFEGGLSLQKWVKNHYDGRAECITDASLASAARRQTPEVRKMWEVAIGELLELGLLCTQESPSIRPTMLDAADDLDRLKRYLAGDTTATVASSLFTSSCTFGETSASNFDDGF